MSDTPLHHLADLASAMNELEAILNEFNTDKSTDADAKIAYTTAQLNAYILTEVLALIGPHTSLTQEEIKGGRIYRLGDPQGDAVDRYKDELAKAAIARFGKDAA